MQIDQKALLLGGAAQYDLCGCPAMRDRRALIEQTRWAPGGVYMAALPGGGAMPLLKTLLTNQCENDCTYCQNRSAIDLPRAGFAPDELANHFMAMHRAGIVRGLFLSSAVIDGSTRTMERMLSAVEIIRRKHDFRGYIHLKILPGAARACVERAVQLATRVSVNLEAPNQRWLGELSSRKQLMEDLVTPMRWVKALQDEGKAGVASGQTTQFIVGATEETDRELLDTVSGLYQDLGLRRAYFSAFRPVVGTPLEHRSPAPPIREHRLYQADFLLRQYGFGFSDLAFEADGSLTLATDPKMVMARQHPEWFPVEVNQAEYETLLRVPGIGPVSAKRIVEGRRESPLTGIEDLRRVGAAAKRAKDYVLISGRSPAEPSAPDEPTLPLGL